MQKIKITFLGTNGWYDTDCGNTVSLLIETPNEYVILDAGNGIYKLDKYIRSKKPIFLFISHFHLDHVIGLHVLAKFNFKQGISLCLPGNYVKTAHEFINKPYTAPLDLLKTKVKIVDLKKRSKEISFLEDYKILLHVVPSYGYRLNFSGKVISYITDTGYCDNAIRLAQRSDLIISECAFKLGMDHSEWPHLTPATAAEIAKVSKSKKLVLTHFDAEVYQTLKERKTAQKQVRNIFKNTIAATDGITISI
ncbi:MBL fold metallo-hydrolase [Candidatus Saganbacteria bacterium]|nr:MBL fold metallo-hydrolase [Candidatus Saganbacteria bacterium]